MTEEWNPPLVPGQVRVVVEESKVQARRLLTRVRVVQGPIPDDVDGPASLLDPELGDGIELHSAQRTGSQELTFTTFGEATPPLTGTLYVIQWWWAPGTREMLIAAPSWRRAAVTDHWFCPLTYDNLDEGDEAYTDDRGNWISVRGWERFVRDDDLHLRG